MKFYSQGFRLPPYFTRITVWESILDFGCVYFKIFPLNFSVVVH